MYVTTRGRQSPGVVEVRAVPLLWVVGVLAERVKLVRQQHSEEQHSGHTRRSFHGNFVARFVLVFYTFWRFSAFRQLPIVQQWALVVAGPRLLLGLSRAVVA